MGITINGKRPEKREPVEKQECQYCSELVANMLVHLEKCELNPNKKK